MANDLEQRRARLAARMRELNVAPDDPRIVLLFAQARQLIRGQLGLPDGLPDTPTAGATSGADGRTSAAVLADLPAGVSEIAQAYIDEQSALPGMLRRLPCRLRTRAANCCSSRRPTALAWQLRPIWRGPATGIMRATRRRCGGWYLTF